MLVKGGTVVWLIDIIAMLFEICHALAWTECELLLDKQILTWGVTQGQAFDPKGRRFAHRRENTRHYSGVIISAMAFEITGVSIV